MNDFKTDKLASLSWIPGDMEGHIRKELGMS